MLLTIVAIANAIVIFLLICCEAVCIWECPSWISYFHGLKKIYFGKHSNIIYIEVFHLLYIFLNLSMWMIELNW
jgi:hypothetical protein